jgi:hypothetical protein
MSFPGTQRQTLPDDGIEFFRRFVKEIEAARERFEDAAIQFESAEDPEDV